MISSPSFSLNNFEGPLELLLCLIQKEEIDLFSVVLKELTTQMLGALHSSPEVDVNSELLTLTATLLLWKSQKLLPNSEALAEEVEEDPRVEMIQSLIEYCRFKDAAKTLSLREEEQKAFFPRATSVFQKELGPGLEEIDLGGLKTLLFEVLAKSKQLPQKIIQEEEWQVSHKIAWFRHQLQNKEPLRFDAVFESGKSRNELIVFFLALLEMLKYQELKVVKTNEIVYIYGIDS